MYSSGTMSYTASYTQPTTEQWFPSNEAGLPGETRVYNIQEYAPQDSPGSCKTLTIFSGEV